MRPQPSATSLTPSPTSSASSTSQSLRTTSFIGALTLLALLGACGKNERQMTTEERLKAVQTKQETQPDFFVQRKSVDYMADLKAIRDAAPKAEPTKQELARAEPVRTVPAITTPAPAPAATPSPAFTQPAPTPAPAQPVTQPAPVTPALTPAPVAVAPVRAPSGDTSVVVQNREQPNFPREAVRQGVESGSVRARLAINAAGDVTGVTIVSARPPRIFDREVQSALQRWKFNAGADGRSYETEINFQR